MRISGLQSHLSSRLNEPRIEFTQEEIENAYGEIIKNTGEHVKKETKVSMESNQIKGMIYK